MTTENSLPDNWRTTFAIAAVVLAAGRSTRMGRPKLTLPWGGATVVGQVVGVLAAAAIAPVVVVSGAEQGAIAQALAATAARVVFNPQYEVDSMLISLQIGLAALPSTSAAALVVLGDQPQIQVDVVEAVAAAYQQTQANVIVPSFQMRRGHPWLVARPLWAELLSAAPDFTLRQFLNQHTAEIHYIPVTTDSILQDLDTPADYARATNYDKDFSNAR
jgi:molybdenum cofactor cytidylyltransferase